MVDTMAVLGAAACAKLTADRLVRDFVTYIRETRITNSEPAANLSRQRRKKNRLSRPLKSSTSGLGPRPSSSRRSKKLSLMTDAELEAELEKRKRRRAKERQVYSRALRSEKLAALELELVNLRREIGRVDPVSSKSTSRTGTPHSVRWEPLPNTRRSVDVRPPFGPETNADAPPATPAIGPAPSAGPPPPPPPPPPPGQNEEEALTIDPEQRKREKEERQRRREAKKKEREQAQKKMTLADIIRSAGSDPMRRLKPAGKKAADVEKEEYEKQKREREEREMRQEQERIEQEKNAIEKMGRRVTDQTSGNANDSNDTGEVHDPQKSCGSETVLAEEATANEVKESAKTAEVPDSTPLVSDELSSKVKHDGSDSCRTIDGAQRVEVESVTDSKKSDSSAEKPTKSSESQKDSSPSSAASGDQTCESNEEKNNPKTEILDTKLESKKKIEEVPNVKMGSNVTQTDTENISPNASTANAVAGDKPERKIVEPVDKRINSPRIL